MKVTTKLTEKDKNKKIEWVVNLNNEGLCEVEFLQKGIEEIRFQTETFNLLQVIIVHMLNNKPDKTENLDITKPKKKVEINLIKLEGHNELALFRKGKIFPYASIINLLYAFLYKLGDELGYNREVWS